jgi:hypothetical protein
MVKESKEVKGLQSKGKVENERRLVEEMQRNVVIP